MELKADGFGTFSIQITALCPNCKINMSADTLEGAWSESDSLVVIPIKCPKCYYTSVVECKFDETTNPNQ